MMQQQRSGLYSVVEPMGFAVLIVRVKTSITSLSLDFSLISPLSLGPLMINHLRRASIETSKQTLMSKEFSEAVKVVSANLRTLPYLVYLERSRKNTSRTLPSQKKESPEGWDCA